MKGEDRSWYVLRTKPRSEKQVYKRLTEIQIETYLPLYTTLRQWSDRRKKIQVPLFPSYVFVNITDRQFHIPYVTPGVYHFINIKGIPTTVPQKDINNLKILMSCQTELLVSKRKFRPGQRVVVSQGILKDLTGELIHCGRAKRLLVRIESIKQNLIIKVPADYLEAIN